MNQLPRLRLVLLLLAAALPLPLAAAEPAWRQQLQATLPRLGHRNWIAIVDAAYPAQTVPGVTTVVTGADHIEVVKAVLEALRQAGHVRPRIHVDAELASVPEEHAPGIGRLRPALEAALKPGPLLRQPHEEIIRRLDEAGRSFEVLVLKTTLKLPYTSVFLELECGYWDEQAERVLRDKLATNLPPH